MKIYKYPIELLHHQKISLPKHSKVRHFGVQDGGLAAWVEVDTTPEVLSEQEIYNFYVVGTGQDIPEDATTYHGTAFLNFYVWHLYSSGYDL